MPTLLQDLLIWQASKTPHKPALGYEGDYLTYEALTQRCRDASSSLHALALHKGQRVAVYLPKSPEAVVSYFSTCLTGGIFVPINWILKTQQVQHILQDSGASILITNKVRFSKLANLSQNTLRHVILIDGETGTWGDINIWNWSDFLQLNTQNGINKSRQTHHSIDTDIAAIFYTSGSTGNAKGVVLSHRNLVQGAKSVAAYLPCKKDDKMLAVQPFSFDYGFSQLTIAFLTGASCYMLDFVFETDLFKVITEQKITTLALVPPLWIKLANTPWPADMGKHIRYFCNTGGAMPGNVLATLRKNMPNAQPFLMYGLTEAFRSCYLPPKEIDKRPGSFGKAIPNADICVINNHGEECQAFEEGELVHRGVLVSQGYWNDKQKTSERFKPAPHALREVPMTEMAVWSGDIVKKDHDGFLYFVGRKDNMIKTSGYRVSPQEVEEVIYQLPEITAVIVFGLPHMTLGQVPMAVITSHSADLSTDDIFRHCQQHLPNYMVPKKIILSDFLPRNANGKFDLLYWQKKYQSLFIEQCL
ncbi:acyl-CoA ligase (AMP-forming), exosortase A system-associated [Paraglaciecola sp.]|uniref:acyl-CoA ligase (AMP-forming), exosortase A system-associated n=1 Tax=Paraglaciecola sp. TaxID=1920173 RepID=UPI0030F44980